MLEHLFASNKFNKDNSKQKTNGHFEFFCLCWYEKPSYLASRILKQIINWWSTLSIISVINKKPSSVGSYKTNTRCKKANWNSRLTEIYWDYSIKELGETTCTFSVLNNEIHFLQTCWFAFSSWIHAQHLRRWNMTFPFNKYQYIANLFW